VEAPWKRHEKVAAWNRRGQTRRNDSIVIAGRWVAPQLTSVTAHVFEDHVRA